MHQIYITSAVTTVLAVFMIGGFIKWRADKADAKLLLILFLAELPMAFAAYYLIRMPLVDSLFQHIFSFNPSVYGFMKLLYAPLTEEPAKLLPLLIPAIRKHITKKNFVVAAMALGLGFGIGEIWLVGNFITQNQHYAAMPWYYFGGFINERFMVCIMHGAFTAIALSRLGNKFWLGILAAMGLHLLGNFPIYLAGIDFLSLGKEAWQIVLQIYIVLFFLCMIGLLAYLQFGKVKIGKFLFRNSVCPGCGKKYDAPLLGLNFFNKRYEPCPHCKKWHWVKMWVDDETDEDKRDEVKGNEGKPDGKS